MHRLCTLSNAVAQGRQKSLAPEVLVSTRPAVLFPTASAPRARRGLWSEEGLEDVEGLMLQLCTGQRLDRLGTILWDHVAGGGKRLRARLVLAAAESLGLARAEAVPWAAACELLHNATLVHDDLQDGDRVRRDREAVWVRHGVTQAINAGDLGLMLPYRALSHASVSDATRWRLADALARGAEAVVRGQAAELDLPGRERITRDDYAHAVSGKTSALFSLPVEGAALLAGMTPEAARAVAAEFAPIGLLFQIQDDVLDLWGDKGRGAPGSDIREGKISAPVVEHLRLHPRDDAWLRGILRLPRERTSDATVSEVIERFTHGGALHAVWNQLASLDDAVCDSTVLARFGRLHSVACELVSRALTPIIHTNPYPAEIL